MEQNGSIEVRLSRPTPATQLGNSNASSLAARVRDANGWGADYFISLHTNASTSPNAGGTEAYVFSIPSRAAELAEDIVDGVSEETGLRDRGILTRSGLYVLRKTKMPAVLVELGFISNPEEAALMRDRPDLFARGIYDGILEFTGV